MTKTLYHSRYIILTCIVTKSFSSSSPFLLLLLLQVQIRYCRKDGSKWLRILTQSRNVTNDHKAVEEASNVAVLGIATVQRAAQLAKDGRLEEARENL